MKSPGPRFPRRRLLSLVLASLFGITTIVGLKLCHDKFRLYREFAGLERLKSEVALLEQNVDDLAASAVELNSRLERFSRLRNASSLLTGNNTQPPTAAQQQRKPQQYRVSYEGVS